jgi:hypothetical protein
MEEWESRSFVANSLPCADEQDEVVIDPSAVATALRKLKNHPEPEARFRRMAQGNAPAYSVQTAVEPLMPLGSSIASGIRFLRGWENRGAMPGRLLALLDTPQSRFQAATCTRPRMRCSMPCLA